MGDLKLGQFAGLDVTAAPSAVAGTVVAWVAFGAIGWAVFHAGALESVAGGFGLALLYWLSELVHQTGHSISARAVGKPMTGVRLYILVGMSIYPTDEGEVTPQQDLRRAVGGPLMSLCVTIGLVVITAVLIVFGLPGAWLLTVLTLANLLVFTLGALLPLGFNDGSSIISALRARRAAP